METSQNPKKVLCVGDLVVDIVASPLARLPEPGEHVLTDRIAVFPGGNALNTAIALRRLGEQVTVAGSLGNDVLGRLLLDQMQRQGLDVRGVRQEPGGRTASTFILRAEGQDRRFIHSALREEMLRDESVFLIGGGIGQRGGSYKVTVGLLDEFGPRRVFDAPISEASFTGAGVGAAITGMRPVVEILFIDFISLIIDQIVNQAAKYRFMSGGKGRVPMVLRTQGGSGNGLAAQHSQSLEAWYYHVPGLKVVMPSTPYDAKGLLKSAIRDDDPVIFIEHKLLYLTEGPVPQDEYTIELGVGDVKRRGDDVTIVVWSNMVLRALSAAAKLAQESIEAEVIDLRTLVPMDKQLVLNSVRKTEHLVIVQEAVRRGGVASDIASIVQAEVFDYLDAPIEIVAGKNTPIPFNVHLEKASVAQEPDIINAVRKVLHL